MDDDLIWCEDCEEKKDEGVRAYECPECGDRFVDEGNGNRSECCNKFSSVISEHACDQCGADLIDYQRKPDPETKKEDAKQAKLVEAEALAWRSLAILAAEHAPEPIRKQISVAFRLNVFGRPATDHLNDLIKDAQEAGKRLGLVI